MDIEGSEDQNGGNKDVDKGEDAGECVVDGRIRDMIQSDGEEAAVVAYGAKDQEGSFKEGKQYVV